MSLIGILSFFLVGGKMHWEEELGDLKLEGWEAWTEG